MRSVVVVAALSLGCMPVRVSRSELPEPQPEPRRFKVGPQTVKLGEPKELAMSRLAQLALTLGLTAEQVSLKDGFFRGHRIRLDQWATDDLYARRKVGIAEVVRKLEITAVAGEGSATLSPRVTRCVRSEGVSEVCEDAFTDLEEDELLILDKLMRLLIPKTTAPEEKQRETSEI